MVTKNWVFILFALVVLLSALGTVSATGPTVPSKGVYCWTPNTDTHTAGYKLYLTDPSGAVTTTDVGKPTTAPPPPDPSQSCAAGAVGIPRDQTGKPDGQYSAQLTAYNSSGVESAKGAAFPFVLQASLDVITPAVPQGFSVK